MNASRLSRVRLALRFDSVGGSRAWNLILTPAFLPMKQFGKRHWITAALCAAVAAIVWLSLDLSRIGQSDRADPRIPRLERAAGGMPVGELPAVDRKSDASRHSPAKDATNGDGGSGPSQYDDYGRVLPPPRVVNSEVVVNGELLVAADTDGRSRETRVFTSGESVRLSYHLTLLDSRDAGISDSGAERLVRFTVILYARPPRGVTGRSSSPHLFDPPGPVGGLRSPTSVTWSDHGVRYEFEEQVVTMPEVTGRYDVTLTIADKAKADPHLGIGSRLVAAYPIRVE